MKNKLLTKRDYFLISLIGASFAIFSIPIMNNVGLLDVTLPIAIALIIAVTIIANAALLISSLIAIKIPVFLQIAKFAAVGGFNTFLDWGVTNILMSLMGVFSGLLLSLISGVGFIVANIASFFWNKNWTFSSQQGTFVAFFSISLVGLIVKMIIVYIVVNVIGIKAGMTPEQWANIGNASATAFSMIWNFIGYKFFVFKK